MKYAKTQIGAINNLELWFVKLETCMKKISFTLLLLCMSSLAFADSVVVPINLVSSTGVGQSIGEIKLSDSKEGLQIVPNLKQLPAGERAIHVHENPSCDPGLKDGVMSPAVAAGPHYDPAHTGKHLGPNGEGHHGDLPVLNVNNSGEAKTAIVAPHLTLAEVHKRAIVIHEGGDNYSDTPKPLGGAGGRIACGVIP